MSDADHTESEPVVWENDIYLPVSRVRAAVRSLLWFSLAGVFVLASGLIYSRLSFTPSGASNRLVEYSVAVIALPLPILSLIISAVFFRWLMLALWPGPIGFGFFKERLEIKLGWFGRARLDVKRLSVRYPFDLDEEAAIFESHLPEELQRNTLVPEMTHPAHQGKINHMIEKFTGDPQEELAPKLREVFAYWQAASQDAN